MEREQEKKRQRTKKTVRGLLVYPGDETLTKVVAVCHDDYKSYSEALDTRRVERYPSHLMMKRIYYEKGTTKLLYRLEIWVDEEALPKSLEYNGCATLTAHPLGERFGRLIHGPALLLDRKGGHLSLDDWENIKQATYYDEQMVQMNYYRMEQRINKRKKDT